MKQEKKTPTKINKKTLQGTVVSSKMQSTVIVAVNRHIKHPKYGKYRRVTKRYKAHNPGETIPVGEKVSIESCRPISKEKHFCVINTEQAKKGK